MTITQVLFICDFSRDCRNIFNFGCAKKIIHCQINEQVFFDGEFDEKKTLHKVDEKKYMYMYGSKKNQ